MEQCIKAIVPDFKIEAEGEPDSGFKKNSQRYMFSLIASDKESLVTFMKTLNKKKKSFNTMTSLLNNDQTDFCAKKGLKIMFDQWKNFVKRPASHASNSLHYWIGKDTNLEDQKIVNNLANPEPVLGKRVLKPKFSLEDVDSSSNDERMSEESVSDWEDGNIRQLRKKPVKTIPRFFDSRFMKFDRKVEDVANPPVKTLPSKTPCQRPVKRNQLLFNGGPPLAKISPHLKRLSSSLNHSAKTMEGLPDSNNLDGALIINMKTNELFTVPCKEGTERLEENPLENALVIYVKTGITETPKIYDPSNDEPELTEDFIRRPLIDHNVHSIVDRFVERREDHRADPHVISHIDRLVDHHVDPLANHRVDPLANHRVDPLANHPVDPNANHHVDPIANHHEDPLANPHAHVDPLGNHHVDHVDNLVNPLADPLALFPLYDQQPVEVKLENSEPLEPFELDQMSPENLDFKDFNFPMI